MILLPLLSEEVGHLRRREEVDHHHHTNHKWAKLILQIWQTSLFQNKHQIKKSQWLQELIILRFLFNNVIWVTLLSLDLELDLLPILHLIDNSQEMFQGLLWEKLSKNNQLKKTSWRDCRDIMSITKTPGQCYTVSNLTLIT